MQVYDAGKDIYLTEPVLVEKIKNLRKDIDKDKEDNEQKLIMSLGINGETEKTELHILDAEKMQNVAILEFENDIAFSFHGAWKSFSNSN